MINRYALAAIAALALAGCGGQIAPTGGAQSSPAAHGKSWMKPGSASGALLYATGGCGGTCVLTYPGLTLIGSLPNVGASICADGKGNIFLPKDGQVVEYGHGGTQPIATLNLPGYGADGCAVDPLTNNLAVKFISNDVDIAIFQDEQGTPATYATRIDSRHCAYDDNGNLFVNGYGGSSGSEFALAELAFGASSFTAIPLSYLVGGPDQLQWDGSYLAYQTNARYGKISRLQVTGSSATIVGTVSFKGVRHGATQSWIYDGHITFPYNIRGSSANVISSWNYPKGGKATNTIRKWDGQTKRGLDFHGVAVSVAPSRPRVRK